MPITRISVLSIEIYKYEFSHHFYQIISVHSFINRKHRYPFSVEMYHHTIIINANAMTALRLMNNSYLAHDIFAKIWNFEFNLMKIPYVFHSEKKKEKIFRKRFGRGTKESFAPLNTNVKINEYNEKSFLHLNFLFF